MNLKEQLYICTLAKYGNITKASDRLFISQPALSAFVSSVEGDLGVKLFERTSKGMQITNAGQIYVRYAAEMLKLKDDFSRDMEELRHQQTSRLHIGIQQRRASFLLPRAWRQFTAMFPDISLEITEGTGGALMEALDCSEIDMAVITASDLPRAYEFAELGEDRILLALARENPLNRHARHTEGAAYPSIDLAHFKDQTFILQQPDQSIRVIIDSILRDAKVKPARIINIRNIETAVQFAGENLGVAFTRESYIRNATNSQRVAYYYIINNRIPEKVVVTWRKNMPLSAPMKGMVAALRAVYNATGSE